MCSARDDDEYSTPEVLDMYTDQNLLRRESIRFDPRVLQVMSTIWKLYDVDESGLIDEEE